MDMCVHMSIVCVCVTHSQFAVNEWTLFASCIEHIRHQKTSPLFSWFGWALTVYTAFSLCTHNKSLGFSNKSTSSLHCVQNAVVCGGLESKTSRQTDLRGVGGRLRHGFSPNLAQNPLLSLISPSLPPNPAPETWPSHTHSETEQQSNGSQICDQTLSNRAVAQGNGFSP